MKTKLHMRVWLWLAAAGLLTTLAGAEEFNNIEYLCCDWGPAMTLPAKTNGVAKYNGAEDEVYFLKQVGSFTRKKPWIGGHDQYIGHGISIWLCKMKPDGSAKTEIKELWKNPAYPIDTQDQNTWMDVNRKTRKIAFSVSYGSSDITGLWSVNIDGSTLKKMIKPELLDGQPTINSPSWTPDGEWLYFEEMQHQRLDKISIIKCDAFGANITRILEATDKIQYREPRVSPDGKRLAFSRYPNGYPGGRYIWTSTLDGKDAAPLGGKDTQQNWGSYPAWSPDGKRILFAGGTGIILDSLTGKVVQLGQPMTGGKRYTFGWPHWGRGGIIGFTVAGILFTDLSLKEATLIGVSRTVKCTEKAPEMNRW
jgi:hypothetical protein